MSHGPLPREAEVDRQLDFLARWKANQYYFYNEASIELDGYPLLNPGGRFTREQVGRIIAYGLNGPELWITTRASPTPGYGHVAVRARGRIAVDAAHAAGLRAGGRDDGPPGPRPHYGERYYAAYLRDPDGLRVEIVSDR